MTDEARNCISNVRPEGQSFAAAAHRLMYLVREARRRRLSGVDLKDEFELPVLPAQTPASQGNFLVSNAAEPPHA